MLKVAKLKKVVAIIAILGMLLFITATPTFASNDNKYFSMTIYGYWQNSYSNPEYRQTTNFNNTWKVNLVLSDEGVGTYTRFWLARSDNLLRVSPNWHDVLQGSGAHYYVASDGSSQTNVRLGAENNNNNSRVYGVAGYWDEETN